jgi:hypothetical protein
MGWWKAKDGVAVVGDEPMDALGGAVTKIVGQYQGAFGRRPTIAEWEALLQTALGLEQPEYRCTDDGVPTKIHITTRS